MTNAAPESHIHQGDHVKEGHFDYEQAGLKMSLEAQAAMPTTKLYSAPENPSQNTEIAAMLTGFSLLEQPTTQPMQPTQQFEPAFMPGNPQPDSLNTQQQLNPLEQALLPVQQMAQNDSSIGQTAALGMTEAVMGGLAGVGGGFAGSDSPAPDPSSDGSYNSTSSDGSADYSPTSSDDSQGDSSYQPSWMQRFMNSSI